MRFFVLSALVVGIITTSLGCSLTEMKTAVAGPETRRALLYQSVEKFHREIGWGSVEGAVPYVAPNHRATYLTDLLGDDSDIKLVDFKTNKVMIDPVKDTNAKVLSTVRYIHNATYLVETRKNVEKWEFSAMNGGWLFSGVEEQPAEEEPVKATPGRKGK